MSYAKWMALLALAVSATGCCTPRWPTQDGLRPSQRFIRYAAQAVKEGDRRCAEAAKTKEEAEACIQVYGELKTTLIKLEGP